MNQSRSACESPNHPELAPPKSWRQGRYGWAALNVLLLVALSGLLRAGLFLAFARHAQASFGEVLASFAVGTWRDLYTALLLCLPLGFWYLIVPNRAFVRRWHRALFWTVFFLFGMAQIFLVAAEYYFFEEFKSRFNTVAVDYLFYPKEVFVNIWDTYPVAWVVAACALVSGAWLFASARLCRGLWDAPENFRRRLAVVGGLLAGCLALSPTIPLKGVHPSPDRTLNEIANNGALAFFCAAWTHHLDYAAFYRTLPLEEAYQRTRRLLSEPGAELSPDLRDIRRRVAGDPNRPRLNVVVFLEESMGSEFWGSLGRKEPSLTPEMDRLAREEGWLFTNIYASGNRTVRGFEGVLSSFPPLPGDSIVKRDLSDNVESLARVLKRDGYSTLFLYGGRGVFDGMRSYARRNGYDRFIEQKDFNKPTFSTIWGVCDEDTFARAIVEFRQLAQAGKPFCGTILSVSNHKPYTYPKGRIPEDPGARRRGHAVKYSDYCLGQFFKAAKQEPFWTNTLFVVVADHGARVYGSQSIPIHSYEIPLLMAGPALIKEPARIGRLGGSLDVAPTILGLLGRPYETMFFGRDLLKSPPETERALMNHNRDIGMYTPGQLVVLGLRQAVEYYEGDPKQAELKPAAQPTPRDLAIEKDCAALYQVADDLYIHRRYRIDPK